MPEDFEAKKDSIAAQHIENIFNIETLKKQGFDMLIDLGTRLAIAILILVIGFWIARRITRLVVKLMEKREIDITLQPFIKGFTSFALKSLIVIIAVSTLGVQMTSIIAILGSIGLAIGLALQGSLANFAGGVIILILKPFKITDYIETSETKGFVQAINIFNTTLLTLDNKTVFVPNGPLAGHTITNYHTAELRRVDINVGISYSNKVDDARKAILDFLNENEKILNEPAPTVFLTQFGASSLDISARVWCKAADYWDVYFWMTEKVKQAFDANAISIPFPQRDVHLITKPSPTETK